MKPKYIITINYYKDKTREEKATDWFNTGKYIVYKNEKDYCNQVKLERVVSINLIEGKNE